MRRVMPRLRARQRCGPGEESELREAVLRYLDEHPEAMDTLEGIAAWWIMRDQVRVEVTAVSRVLQRLTGEGLLEAIEAGGVTRYRRRV
jgi:hypothetical protein